MCCGWLHKDFLMLRSPKPSSLAHARSTPTCAPSTGNSTSPHAMKRPSLPSNSISSSYIMSYPLNGCFHTFHLNSGHADTPCLGNASPSGVTPHPPFIDRQYNYVDLPM